MYCPNCGNELPDNSKFCGKCGSPQGVASFPEPNNTQMNEGRSTPTVKVKRYALFIWGVIVISFSFLYLSIVLFGEYTGSPVPLIIIILLFGFIPGTIMLIGYIIYAKSIDQMVWYRRWWIWIIVGVGSLIIISAVAPRSSSNTSRPTESVSEIAIISTTEDQTAAPTEKPTQASTEKPTQKPTKSPADIEQEFKDSCSTIDYATLARNPDKYKGNKYVFTGEVIQVTEPSSWVSGDTVVLRINVTEEPYEYIEGSSWKDTIYATVEIPDGEDRILEDDIITFWGTCDGMYTYTAVLGNSISLPKIDIKYFELRN